MRLPRSFGVCLFVLLLAAATQAQGAGGRSARAQAKLDALRERIDTVRQQIAADKSQRGDLADALARAEAEISSTSKRLRELDDAIAEQQQRIDHLTRRRDAERGRLMDRLTTLRTQVRAAHRSGSINRMRLMLSGESPERLGRMLVYYEYFARAQSRQIDRLKTALSDLAAHQRALEDGQQALARRRQIREQTLSQLESSQAQRRETIAALDARLSRQQSSLEDLRAGERRLKKLMDSLQKQLADLPQQAGDMPFAQLKGHMTPPVNGPLLARFGTQKAGPLKWQGEWLGADSGTPVRAVAAGRVVYVGYMHRYGLIVVLDHGHDYYTVYGHAESAYVEVGDTVRRGQAVAKAGQSGGHHRSGAYFEIRKGRTPIDPAQWLSG